MSHKFKFPLYSKVARSETEPRLLIVGYEMLAIPNFSRIYWTIDQDGVRDWEYADILEDEFHIVGGNNDYH